ncbi:unnamed protein product [Peronospora destructor]|uniref:Uncharacterized protein n=1 Tax=Peronospora destructor TaxID=86335 RepID=A0AAV0VF72_9STRA|nr:unnamed protein product [Peronospora destructor]
MRVVAPSSSSFRYSESALPEHFDPSFQLPPSTHRNSLAMLEKPHAGFSDSFALRDSCTSEASGFDVLNFWNLETDHDASQSQVLTPTEYVDAYQGVTIEVNNHSVNNQGVVMYHVDIKTRDGILILQETQMDAALTLRQSSPQDGLKPHSIESTVQQHWQENPPVSSYNRQDRKVSFVTQCRCVDLFETPDARLVEQRKKRFQEILRLAIRHPATKNSVVLDEFLRIAPSEISQRGPSYVSLWTTVCRWLTSNASRLSDDSERCECWKFDGFVPGQTASLERAHQ